MKTVCDYDKCTDCKACLYVCKKNAITIKDSVFAYNAVIDTQNCVGCGLCHRSCQVNNPEDLLAPIRWQEGWINNEDKRKQSSSGGIARALSECFVNQGGVVCSCVNHGTSFVFEAASNIDEISKFSGSKYCKSNLENAYKIISESLKNNKKVLFIGLPCQAAAIKKVFKRFLSNLYIVDLICHGTPSIKLLESYLKNKRNCSEEISSIEFRKKLSFGLTINSNDLYVNNREDFYTYCFLKAIDYTENCYECAYAQTNRVGDITLGDSWDNDFEDNIKQKGVSLVLYQTEKGKQLIEDSDTFLVEANVQRAIESNHQLLRPSFPSKYRKAFLSRFLKYDSFDKAFLRTFPCVFIKKGLKNYLKCFWRK